ncbi:ATP-binding cassette domain-containing protein [Ruegeria sediminis]|uniref:ATP-binding cassette domain-containing protein n=1 Tax=Ruegeria sediminis TaxID=2583820 RepID=A0ABY2X2M2_9RHOB|nr:ABC transporter ATP-binding protein [Ruegeria sediminis]TMV09103.1 ATP-binding cassette domain-containing protein [Ruegeria sediminis]
MTGLRVENLSFSYRSKTALSGVSFEVASGMFCALLGPNGAGKSTLFALMTRLFTSPQGRIEIAGHDMARSPRAALKRMGVVFQQPTLDLDLTVQRNLDYFSALHGLSGRTARSRIDEALDRLGMRDKASEIVRNLNGGHRRRLEIARCLCHRPKVLLLDEPTVGLDAATRQAITEHVHDLSRSDGLTVLWATHLTDEIRDGDQLLVLHHGRLLENGQTGELRGGVPLAQHFLSLTGETE